MYYPIYLLSLLPFGILYVLSDLAYIIMYYVVGYRRDVVRKNLTTSFPEKTESEIKGIERKFYHWLCDYFVETIKLLSISDKQLRRRLKVVGAEQIEGHFKAGQDCAALLGHYCNWEWLSCVGIAFHEGRKMGLVYKPLRSKSMDKLFRRIRSSQPSGIVVPKNDILRELVKLRRDGVRSLFGYIADQGPRYINTHLWLPFLNHDTGVFTGSERIIRKMNNAVYYAEMERPRRGYYTVTFHLLTDDPKSMPENELTSRFFVLLEQTIRRHPEYYLWTHNRWKRTHEEFNRMYRIENGKVVNINK
mgnify:FL=1